MEKRFQKVDIVMRNRPGALDRVIGHIRREGWNIKSIRTEESENPDITFVAMEIEGIYSKLAQILDKFAKIDCIVQATMNLNGEVIVKENKYNLLAQTVKEEKQIQPAPKKQAGKVRILTINPGSTSTKFAIYDDDEAVLTEVIRHDQKELVAYGSVLNQKDIRLRNILDVLELYDIPLDSFDAIAGRGGLLQPIESGVYIINERMLADLRTTAASTHASSLGAIIAKELADQIGINAYVVDPVVVDELDPAARISGMPGVERMSVFHALNHKATARRLANELGRPYESLRLVIAHLGGGISVGAHRYGRVIDVNDGLYGEGPFSPERTGSVPAVPLIKMCFSGEYTQQEMIDRVTRGGGMQSYIGTNDMRTAQQMINEGDEFATLVVDSMAYQVAKEIGSMIAVLEGRVDAIVLTGGLAYSNRFTGAIKQKVDALAPVYVFPGEDEMLALKNGVLRVLKGQESSSEYI